MFPLDDFIIRALLAGMAVVLMTGALGVVLLWRRMAYFGDTLSHSALLGVAVGVLLGANVNVFIVLVCVLIALGLLVMQREQRLGGDALLGVMGHGALALGMVSLAFIPGTRVDLMGYLFGDILAVSWLDVSIAWSVAVLVLSVLAWIWRALLSLTVHEELAQADGINPLIIHGVYMVLVALMVAMAMKVVGVLLVTALLIMPAATARVFAKTPEQMLLGAMLLGVLALCLGMAGSLLWDTPTGPSIVLGALLLFVAGRLLAIRGAAQ